MKRSKGAQNDYAGYVPDKEAVPVVSLDDIASDDFYKDYILARKPVVIQGIISELDISKFQPDTIVDLLKSDDLLLVEKKDKGGYGSGTERLKMSFETFMNTLKAGADEYYLTTQYADDDPDVLRRLQGDSDGSDDEDTTPVSTPGSEDEDKLPVSAFEEEEEDKYSEDDDEDMVRPPVQLSDTEAPNYARSEADSIDFNDLHDDFDALSETSNTDDDELITTDVPGEPLHLSEATVRVQECLQKPLTKLVRNLPLQPSIINRLIPQQINLWAGKYSDNEQPFQIDETAKDLGLGRRIFGGGVSSGLHHDHADNLYIPMCGSKRFTIFSPLDSEKMDTVGSINKVYPSGVIDYKPDGNAPGWRALRGDSAIITEVSKWRLDNEQMTDDERNELLKGLDEESQRMGDSDVSVVDKNGIKRDPPSFSRIPAALLHLDRVEPIELRQRLQEYAESRWPSFLKAQRMSIDLEPGQMLYLPAGWFHEVTSYGSPESQDFHIALNYWFSPPDADPYGDEYWVEDFKRTLASCEHFKSL